ncbi:MAG: UDPGP type 1 family protein [Planctomycetes bacterium]|nr:UDPGP type 1 family protein [Planctomycetota bacterium]
MSAKNAALRARFCEAEQGHVFRFFDDLGAEQRATLLAQLRSVDLALVKRLIEAHLVGEPTHHVPRLEPANVIGIATDSGARAGEAASRTAGEAALQAGRVGVIIVAGGQASRLGYDAPKGFFPIGPVSAKSLFQVHAEKVLALGRRYAKAIPLLLLVSPDNHAVTRSFFEQHRYFGLNPKDVTFLEQGMLPALDRDGRLLLAERGRIFLSPDGHGGVFRALTASGAVDQLKRRGIDTLFYFQVDNPLVKVADPVFLGHHLLRDAEFSLKVVAKRDAAEKVGVFATIDGRPGIVEYSDLPEPQRAARDAAGNLQFGAGSIAIHAFSLAFFERLGRGTLELPYHVARKKVPYVDDSGDVVTPAEPNGVKFESFVFDGLALAQRTIAMEVLRSEEFAPVKNRSGEDSPDTARAAWSSLHRGWLASAGISLPVGTPAEVGPLLALDAEELAARMASGTVGRLYVDGS